MQWEWRAVNWLALLPPLFSIYSILIAGLAGKYLESRVESLTDKSKNLQQKKDVIRYVASGWATLLGFFNALFAALLAPFAIYSTSRSFGWTAGTTILVVVTFATAFWWVLRYNLDELTAGTTKIGWSPAGICKAVLIFVNLVLLAAILVNQQLSSKIA